MTHKTPFSELLVRGRKQAGLTQRAVEQQTHIDHRKLSNLENGHGSLYAVSLENAIALSRALNLPLKDIADAWEASFRNGNGGAG